MGMVTKGKGPVESSINACFVVFVGFRYRIAEEKIEDGPGVQKLYFFFRGRHPLSFVFK